MSESIKRYYDFQVDSEEGVSGAGLIWQLGRDYLSPSYDNSEEIALHPARWREGAKGRVLHLARAMGIDSSSFVLDIGSGIGGPGRDIQAATGCEMVGLNLSLTQLRSSLGLSRTRNPDNPPLTYLVNGDAQWLPFKTASFNHVYAINTFYHIPQIQQAIAEVARVLKPGGKSGLDDWFLTHTANMDVVRELRHRWSSPLGFHTTSEVRRLVETHQLRVVKVFDYTQEAAVFLTENRFGQAFDREIRPRLIETFPRLYKYEGYTQEHAENAVLQLRSDILYMGALYRSAEAVYQQLVAEKL